jgi:hypothetical protein
MALSPSQTIVQSAYQETTVTDRKGRTIKFRRLNALDRARLFKAAGAADSQNAPYVGMAMIAAHATEIDGVPIPFPNKQADIESIIARLDDPGMDAIAGELAKELDTDDDSAATAA